MASWVEIAGGNASWSDDYVHPRAVVWSDQEPMPRTRAAVKKWDTHLFAETQTLTYEISRAGIVVEGGTAVAASIERIVAAEIPVMGHVGLTPQSVHRMGGYRVQGRGEAGRARVLADARAVEQAGAFACVLEGMPSELAREITGTLSIPTIGIGAGVHCDGQVLVMHDLLGLSDWTPSFVKRYADLGAAASKAARAFADEVRERKFPAPEHAYR